MSDSTYVSFPGLGIDTFEMKKNVIDDLFGTGLSIAWYGLLITLGIVLAGIVVSYNAKKKEGFILDSYFDYFLAGLPLSIVGARFMYVLFKLGDYLVYNADGSFSLGSSLKKMVAVWEGGLAVYGGVIFGFAVIILVARFKKNNPLQVLDAIIPGLMLAQAIGRWGNFVNGEAHGGETDLPWRMVIGLHGKPVHPTFFYESFWNFVGFLLVMLLLYRVGKKKFHGEILSFYMIWYGVGRAVVEGLRTDSLMLGPLRISQVIGIVSALGGVALWLLARKKWPVTASASASESKAAPAEEAGEAKDEAKTEGAPQEDGAKESGDEEKESEEK